jgi:FAD/FMN-containing dehydrogenase
MNTLLDGGFPDGAFNYWRSSFTEGLSDGLIDAAVESFAAAASPMASMLFEHFHGAVTRIGATDTAVPHRAPGWNLLIPTIWTERADTEANVRWTRETHSVLQPHLASGRWLNYLADDEAEDAIRAAYGPNYERLREIKRRYDPDNVFQLNHNISP